MKKITLCGLLALGVGCDGSSGDDTGEQIPRRADAAGDASLSDAVARDMAPPPPPPAWPVTQCDDLMPAACSMPWPSNLYLEPDEARETGHTLSFGVGSLPVNWDAIGMDPEPYRRMDGYGPGEPLLVLFPNLDASQLPDENAIEDSLAEDAKILWYEVTEGGLQRVPYWAELDGWEGDLAKKTLFVRPAVLLKEKTRYVVAFRGLQDTEGTAFEPSEAFAALRDGTTEIPLAYRQARFNDLLGLLDAEGVPRETLTLAWDFNTASSQAMHGRLLEMRDHAFEEVGERGPLLTITEVVEFTEEEDPLIALELQGTFNVPHYMKATPAIEGHHGWVFSEDFNGQLVQNGTRDPQFWVRVPRSALSGAPHGLVQYGHGLLGNGTQVRGSFNSKIANDERLIFFACDWTGMSELDEPAINIMITELSRMPWLADRMHQGIIESLLLARAMRDRLGVELEDRGVRINQGELFYSGISQGGIYGATYMAMSQDVTRGHLGVPGQNYSTLLHRSVDFEPFFAVVAAVYPSRADQAIALSAIQLLWNATDPVSHYRHISESPHPDTPAHQVLGAVARGDYQVAPVTMEIVARTGLMALMENYDDERSPALVEATAYPHTGSALTNWHFGNPWPPAVNRPPEEDELGDPHGKPRRDDEHNRQMVHFFRTGEVIDVCNGGTCPAGE